MNITDTADLWWKNSVFYCASVRMFLDWDGDGNGDLRGMARRIDYLADLGINCLWLMPFHATGDVDDGYDISDFYSVDPRLGTLGDFVELVETAHSRGMKVIIDFVMNHTSDKHDWFKQARRSKDDPKRDWYVWRDSTPPDTADKVVFPDKEDSIWQYDERTGEWYLHNFYKQQPDLNIANPQVRDEIARTMGFWLQLGIDGFRVDAVPFLFQEDSVPGENLQYDPHAYLRDLRAYMDRRRGRGILLGEVNVPHKEQQQYFGGTEGDELNMQFDFIGMQALYLSLARQDARPLVAALEHRPDVDPDNQWAMFLRNHDELTLDKLNDKQRQEVFDAFGSEPEMQLFGRGLRRRLPPMLGGDERRLRMAYSLIFALPGTPVLFYGEEIGMGENLTVEGRLSVRTPMQWSPDPDGGFSTAPPRSWPRRMPDGPYGPEHVNVSSQRNDPDSFLSFMKRLIDRYRLSPEIGWSQVEILDQPHDAVLAHVCRKENWTMVGVHNFGAERLEVPLAVPELPEGSSLIDLLIQGDRIPLSDDGETTIVLEGYGYRWLRVANPGDRRIV